MPSPVTQVTWIDAFLRTVAHNAVAHIQVNDPDKEAGSLGDFHNFLGERIYKIVRGLEQGGTRPYDTRSASRLPEDIACELSRLNFKPSTHTLNRVTQQAKAVLATVRAARTAFRIM